MMDHTSSTLGKWELLCIMHIIKQPLNGLAQLQIWQSARCTQDIGSIDNNWLKQGREIRLHSLCKPESGFPWDLPGRYCQSFSDINCRHWLRLGHVKVAEASMRSHWL